MIAVGTSNCHAIVPGGHDPAGEIVALLRILTGHGRAHRHNRESFPLTMKGSRSCGPLEIDDVRTQAVIPSAQRDPK